MRATATAAGFAALAAALAACSGDDGLRVTSATPPYGPLVGGSRVTIAGAGFGATGTLDRVFIAGREAALVAVVDDDTIDAVIPPGTAPGDAEILILAGDRNVRATGVFHYSAPPTIDAVSPSEVLFSSQNTRVTVIGSGFVDEAAGTPFVVLDGTEVRDLVVIDDHTLVFTAWNGRALLEPDLELVNTRGRANKSRVFRYLPSEHPGLLLFPTTASLFALYFDPSDLTYVVIPWVVTPSIRYTAVVHGDRDDYWGLDRSRRFGRIDMRTQRLEAPIQASGWYPTLIRDGDRYFAIERSTLHFGELDPATGVFFAIGDTPIPCCGSYGLAAADDGTMYFTARQGSAVVLGTIDRKTGEQSALISLTGPPGLHIEEMRFFAGKLYAVSRDGTLVTIDTKTGVVTTVPISLGRFNAMETYP